MGHGEKPSQPELKIEPFNSSMSIRSMVYSTLKRAITELDIYEHNEEIRLDERKLSEELAVSRTPIREALTLLEQEGFVRSVPRRGVFVMRKTKKEVVEMIIAWAALESMAARLASHRATESEFAELRAIMREFENGKQPGQLTEYSGANIAFHQKIIELGHCEVIADISRNFFIHVRGIRKVTIHENDRAERSVTDHMNIIRALEARDAELAERLVREHTLGLAAHVEKYGDFLDPEEASERSGVSSLIANRRANSQAILLKILKEGAAE